MENAEFLRALIEYIDSIRDSVMAPGAAPVAKTPEVAVRVDPKKENAQNIVINVNSPQESPTPAVDPREVNSPVDDDETFVPPLQAHLEIMKKMAGIPIKNQDVGTDNSNV